MRVKLIKIKLFTDNDITNLEKKINSWFKKNKYIEVVQILQSEYAANDSSDSRNGNLSRTITVCYKEIEEPSSVIPEWSPDCLLALHISARSCKTQSYP